MLQHLAEIESQLFLGSAPPDAFDPDDYVRCRTAATPTPRAPLPLSTWPSASEFRLTGCH